jgi:hypothetical protein
MCFCDCYSAAVWANSRCATGPVSGPTSAIGPETDMVTCDYGVRSWGDCVAKLPNYVRRFSRQSTKQSVIVDRYGAKLVSQVTREFITM